MDSPDSPAQAVRQLEERLVQAEIRQSRVDLEVLLADEFREFGSSGEIYDKERVLGSLQSAPSFTIRLEDFQTRVLSETVVLATYVAATHRPERSEPSRSLRSSLWRRHNGRWQVVFHQGTRCGTTTGGSLPPDSSPL